MRFPSHYPLPIRFILPLLALSLSSLWAAPLEKIQNWPQAAGPSGNWAAESADAPLNWSVIRNENILWKTTLPEVGQGGIAVWGDHLFITTLKPEEDKKPSGREVVGYCLDARDGKILWTAELPGNASSVPGYFFSDATSPSPITDGEYVWFFNACGSIGCYKLNGERV